MTRECLFCVVHFMYFVFLFTLYFIHCISVHGQLSQLAAVRQLLSLPGRSPRGVGKKKGYQGVSEGAVLPLLCVSVI